MAQLELIPALIRKVRLPPSTARERSAPSRGWHLGRARSPVHAIAASRNVQAPSQDAIPLYREQPPDGSHLLGHTDHSYPSRLVTRDLVRPFVEDVSVMPPHPGPADLSMLCRCRFKRLP